MSKLALVLAGGGSLGAYEVGAIEALEELGYKFDIVTGTSIGALNAAFVCNKQTYALRRLWENITPEKVMVNGVSISKRELDDSSKKEYIKEFARWGLEYFKGRRPGADISPFKEYVKNAIDVDACYDSDIKYGIVTTQVRGMRMINVDMHSLPKHEFLPYLHASSACFPIFPMEKIGERLYVDGFYKDNLPITLAFSMGADEVIAIDMKLFSLEPRHKFYLSLPNVTYIAPYIKMGSMVDFSQEVIRKNIKLGYLDVMKHYHKYLGFEYTFKPFKAKGPFLSFLLEQFETNSKYILDLLSEGIRTPMDERDYFIRSLEVVADKLGIEDYYRVHTLSSFRSLLKNRIVELMNSDSFSKYARKEKLALLANYRKNSVLYSYLAEFLEHFLDLKLANLLSTRKLITTNT